MRIALQNARKSKKLFQAQVAQYLGMRTKAYQRIEGGTRGTSESNWLKLYEYFDRAYPLHELMETTQAEK